MNELLDAAKAVIEAANTGDRWCAIANLKTAVERAENPQTDFDKWWEQTEIWPSEYTAAASAWTAAQQAERERIKSIIESMDVPWWLVEKIDDL